MSVIPVIGWVFSFILSVSLAIPFWLIWTLFGVGENFEFLPQQFQSPGFWTTVGVFMCVGILRTVVLGMPVTKKYQYPPPSNTTN